ncbi:tripartite tricarboxylate transporter substrate binding protein [Roseomonas alkaliterrae]|uniref:Tripartite-type tricarboxylate transporter receptor subunit TctC n=1 Tax=Neoroseomonas alkaliterrae TaxID=1452450 RepID=A0A840XQH7_9PROT|nr:tripartite tricarboxylate transporter substrate binding protein [Neoroseomonas alkaliterrae]MBB5688949.1 tripartite-type tricarboxylate transporter receptor subunit TctC [Neoroseomonas alkaliterrae]MBR0674824.1 tripartite tricarboxylate transporter substrate binding protein [Neoroseomonas alkaliterrae]
MGRPDPGGASTRRSLLALAAAPTLARPALALPAWPTGPVRYICVFPPGGSTDLLSRIWCQRMSEITGQTFVVENRGGSGGNVGTEVIARAQPDGYTIGLATVASLAIAPTLYRRLPFDVTRDFTYVCGLWQLPNLLVARTDLPARDIPELIALCRAEPGRYTFASAGAGTTLHIAGEMFKRMAGVDLLHVPYRGGGPAYTDLLGGRVDMIFGNFPEANRLSREGKVRPLAVTAATRSPQAPDVPAMAEFLPGYEINSWGGVCGPAGIPPAIVARMAALGREAVESPEVRRRFEEGGATVWWTTPEGLADFRRENQARFAPVIIASGARVE